MTHIPRKKTKYGGQNTKPPISPVPTITNKESDGNSCPKAGDPNKNESHTPVENISTVRIKNNLFNSVLQVCLVLAAIASPYVVWLETSQQNTNTELVLKATQRSVNLTETNYIIENRAWVGVSQQEFNPNMFVYIKNFGKTPAESLCIGRVALLRNTPPTSRPQVVMDKPTSLAPSEISARINFDERGIARNCYYGIITYTDIYGRRDTTEFTYFSDKVNGLQRIGINRMK